MDTDKEWWCTNKHHFLVKQGAAEPTQCPYMVNGEPCTGTPLPVIKGPRCIGSYQSAELLRKGAKRAACPECGRHFKLTKRGAIPAHEAKAEVAS